MGYQEWLFHPEDASEILATGRITVNGDTLYARQVDECQGYPQIQVWR